MGIEDFLLFVCFQALQSSIRGNLDLRAPLLLEGQFLEGPSSSSSDARNIRSSDVNFRNNNIADEQIVVFNVDEKRTTS